MHCVDPLSERGEKNQNFNSRAGNVGLPMAHEYNLYNTEAFRYSATHRSEQNHWVFTTQTHNSNADHFQSAKHRIVIIM